MSAQHAVAGCSTSQVLRSTEIVAHHSIQLWRSEANEFSWSQWAPFWISVVPEPPPKPCRAVQRANDAGPESGVAVAVGAEAGAAAADAPEQAAPSSATASVIVATANRRRPLVSALVP